MSPAEVHRRQAFDHVLDAVEQLTGSETIRGDVALAADLWFRSTPDGSGLAPTSELQERVTVTMRSLLGAATELHEADLADLVGEGWSG